MKTKIGTYWIEEMVKNEKITRDFIKSAATEFKTLNPKNKNDRERGFVILQSIKESQADLQAFKEITEMVLFTELQLDKKK